MNNIAFPDVTSFWDIFTKVASTRVSRGTYLLDMWTYDEDPEPCVLSRYITFSSYDVRYIPSLTVIEANHRLIDFVKNNCSRIPYEHLYLKININKNNKSIFSITHNKIIGDYKIAIIDTNTIPILTYQQERGEAIYSKEYMKKLEKRRNRYRKKKQILTVNSLQSQFV